MPTNVFRPFGIRIALRYPVDTGIQLDQSWAKSQAILEVLIAITESEKLGQKEIKSRRSQKMQRFSFVDRNQALTPSLRQLPNQGIRPVIDPFLNETQFRMGLYSGRP